MDGLGRLLLLGLTVLKPAERLSAGASRFTTAALFSAAAVFALGVGISCLIAAAWIALIPVVGAVSAALIAGACFFLAATILWLLARARIMEDRPKHDEGDPLAMLSELLGSGQGGDLKRLLSENKLPLLLAALVLGLTMGGGSRRR